MPSSLNDELQKKIVNCEKCPRLRQYCEQIGISKRKSYQEDVYWARPVPHFGTPPASLLIVGLAPAAHGANRSGRMFSGDRSGEWLYRALHKSGFANQSQSGHIDDGLKLTDCLITTLCHCAPPANKPLPQEIKNCSPFLFETWGLSKPKVVLALGQMAWRACLQQALSRNLLNRKEFPDFKHGQQIQLRGSESPQWIKASYHPSQQNTFTGVLNEKMLDDIFVDIQNLLSM